MRMAKACGLIEIITLAEFAVRRVEGIGVVVARLIWQGLHCDLAHVFAAGRHLGIDDA